MVKRMCLVVAVLLCFSCAGLSEEGILYTASPSADSGGYCVLTLRDALRITPDDTFGPDIQWHSSDPAVAAVEDGLVLPIRNGHADILFTDGEKNGVCCVLVDTMADEIREAGSLQILLNGERYETGLSELDQIASGQENGYVDHQGEYMVIEMNGEYYVRSRYLFNIVCCALGEAVVVTGNGLPQLSGRADIRNMNAASMMSQLGPDVMLYTYPMVFSKPDGSYAGRDLYTVIYDRDWARTVYYGCLPIGNVIYESVTTYLDCFGVDYTLTYDEAEQVLTVCLTRGEE